MKPGGTDRDRDPHLSTGADRKRYQPCARSSIPGLYPCGEGAGYAGGIVSAAVDGLKVAEQIIASYRGPLPRRSSRAARVVQGQYPGKLTIGGMNVGTLFGTDGVRGIANVELTPELAFNLGRAGSYVWPCRIPPRDRVFMVGKDTRVSGDMLEAALIAGICSTGADVLDCGGHTYPSRGLPD